MALISVQLNKTQFRELQSNLDKEKVKHRNEDILIEFEDIINFNKFFAYLQDHSSHELHQRTPSGNIIPNCKININKKCLEKIIIGSSFEFIDYLYHTSYKSNIKIIGYVLHKNDKYIWNRFINSIIIGKDDDIIVSTLYNALTDILIDRKCINDIYVDQFYAVINIIHKRMQISDVHLRHNVIKAFIYFCIMKNNYLIFIYFLSFIRKNDLDQIYHCIRYHIINAILTDNLIYIVPLIKFHRKTNLKFKDKCLLKDYFDEKPLIRLTKYNIRVLCHIYRKQLIELPSWFITYFLHYLNSNGKTKIMEIIKQELPEVYHEYTLEKDLDNINKRCYPMKLVRVNGLDLKER